MDKIKDLTFNEALELVLKREIVINEDFDVELFFNQRDELRVKNWSFNLNSPKYPIPLTKEMILSTTWKRYK